MNEKAIIVIAVFCVCGILIWDQARDAVSEIRDPKKYNIKISFMGKDSEIPKDGELLIIDHSGEDTIFVREAEETDIKKYIRRHEH